MNQEYDKYIVKKYIKSVGLDTELYNWCILDKVYIDISNEYYGDHLYDFDYTSKASSERYGWYIPKEYYHRELNALQRNDKIKILLKCI